MKHQIDRDCSGRDLLGVRYWGVITVFLGLCWGMPVEATVYRCTDEAGGVVFQQVPCADGEVVDLDVRTTRWVASPKLERSSSPRKRKRRDADALSRKARAEERQQKACWRARQAVERISRNLRRGYTASQGERWRQRRREKEDYIRRFCR